MQWRPRRPTVPVRARFFIAEESVPYNVFKRCSRRVRESIPKWRRTGRSTRMSSHAVSSSGTRNITLSSVKGPAESWRTRRRPYYRRKNLNVAGWPLPRKATWNFTGAIAYIRHIPLNTVVCARAGESMLSSLPSSHRPIPVCDVGPSDAIIGQVGDVCGLRNCWSRHVFGFVPSKVAAPGICCVCERVPDFGPSRA